MFCLNLLSSYQSSFFLKLSSSSSLIDLPVQKPVCSARQDYITIPLLYCSAGSQKAFYSAGRPSINSLLGSSTHAGHAIAGPVVRGLRKVYGPRLGGCQKKSSGGIESTCSKVRIFAITKTAVYLKGYNSVRQIYQKSYVDEDCETALEKWDARWTGSV